MRSHLSLGRILGFPVDLHFSLLLLLAFILIFGGGLPGLWLTLLVLASVLAHELGHSVMARRLGIGIEGITLYPFGGVARMRSMPEKPRDEVIIAAAGPAVSLLLAGAFFTAFLFVGGELLMNLAAINAVLGIFNLIPALPMDGGRIFRALLAERLGFLRATTIAAKVARVAAVGLALLGLFTNPMLVVIAGVVWWMAGRELLAARMAAAGPYRVDPRIDPELLRLLEILQRGQHVRPGPAGPAGARASQMVVEVR
ncbi:MAG: M50 family metallopeptidase [Deltaproteobacteria bacterium]|nr:M50 family metallopeptidase [Deltaproteobacteria bacterium]